MRRLRKLVFVPAVAAVWLAGAIPAFADNVCPVIGGPSNPTIMGTPAVVKDMDGNPAHGANPADPKPGEAFWN
ncbi:MAG TPA: hypothetical protein VGL99_06840 [Chloroflexota bacterium]|jgi:hypothetical protein